MEDAIFVCYFPLLDGMEIVMASEWTQLLGWADALCKAFIVKWKYFSSALWVEWDLVITLISP